MMISLVVISSSRRGTLEDVSDQRPEAPDDEPGATPSSSPTAGRRHHPDEVLPKTTSDERDIGWGDVPSEYTDEWYLAERPPHHE
jgi:hypothetical protein